MQGHRLTPGQNKTNLYSLSSVVSSENHTLKIFIQYSIQSQEEMHMEDYSLFHIFNNNNKKAPIEDLNLLFNIFSRESIHTEESKTFIYLLAGWFVSWFINESIGDWLTGWQRKEMINWFTNWLTDLHYCLWLNAEGVIKKKIYVCSSRHLWLQTLLFHSNLTNTKNIYKYTDTVIKTWVKGRFPLATHSNSPSLSFQHLSSKLSCYWLHAHPREKIFPSWFE